MRFYIENMRGEDGIRPLVYDSEDHGRAVPLRKGKKAAIAAERIAGCLENIGRDYGIDDEIIHAPYKLELSWSPLPIYKGLDKQREDRIILPKYWLGPAGHEGSHMGHRRLLQHRMKGDPWAKLASEKELARMYKRDLPGVESFANEYGGLKAEAMATNSALMTVSSLAMLPVTENIIGAAQNASQNLPELAMGAGLFTTLAWLIYSNGRQIAAYFQDKSKIKA